MSAAASYRTREPIRAIQYRPGGSEKFQIVRSAARRYGRNTKLAAPFIGQPASDHITDLRADIANVRLDELRAVGKNGAPATQREALQDSPAF